MDGTLDPRDLHERRRSDQEPGMTDIAIIGGGITGLALTHRLRSRGKGAILLEAETRLGGNIETMRRDGFITETGPNSFLDKEPATRELAASVGVENLIRAADP